MVSGWRTDLILTNYELPVMASWMQINGRRLDCNPYLSGAFEAKVRLEKLRAKKQPLQAVTKGGLSGIYHAGREGRTYVDDPKYGVPFLGSTDILAADLSHVSLLSKKQVAANPSFTIEEGWTLITRSGTIGRMAYVRPDMAGMACSEHVMRVVPDTDKIHSGYLYAYLSSKFGVPIVVSGTYGAIIQHIEPEHIANLPVPRLGEEFEGTIDALIRQSADLRVAAARLLEEAKHAFDCLVSDDEVFSYRNSQAKISIVPAAKILKRLDAAFHNPLASRIQERVLKGKHTTIGEMCHRVFLPGIFKRIQTDDLAFGAPYYSGASLYWLEPIPKNILSQKTSLYEDVLLQSGTILVQAFGQGGGLIGRPTWVGNYLDGAATTHMLVRLNTHEPELAGYLYAYLDSSAGYTQISRLPFGGSIPHLDEKGISSVPVPLMPKAEMLSLGEKVLTAMSSRDEALALERQARELIEEAIGSGRF